jgi:hypothetical protein
MSEFIHNRPCKVYHPLTRLPLASLGEPIVLGTGGNGSPGRVPSSHAVRPFTRRRQSSSSFIPS